MPSTHSFHDVAVIYNPKSTGDAELLAKELRKQLRARGITCRLYPTKMAKHASEIAYTICKKKPHTLIVASSGDGGLNEVINGIAYAIDDKQGRVYCATLPAGNANDYARTVQQKPLIELLDTDSFAPIDLLELTIKVDGELKTKQFAHSYIGLGLTAEAGKHINKGSKTFMGDILSAIKAFRTIEPLRIKLKNNNYTLDSLIATNHGEMAKTLTLAKNSTIDDGLFEIIATPRKGFGHIARLLMKASIGSLHADHHYTEFSFTVLRKAAIQLDGEIISAPTGSEVIIRTRKHMIEVLR